MDLQEFEAGFFLLRNLFDKSQGRFGLKPKEFPNDFDSIETCTQTFQYIQRICLPETSPALKLRLYSFYLKSLQEVISHWVLPQVTSEASKQRGFVLLDTLLAQWEDYIKVARFLGQFMIFLPTRIGAIEIGPSSQIYVKAFTDMVLDKNFHFCCDVIVAEIAKERSRRARFKCTPVNEFVNFCKKLPGDYYKRLVEVLFHDAAAYAGQKQDSNRPYYYDIVRGSLPEYVVQQLIQVSRGQD